jgi:hypothetical protein
MAGGSADRQGETAMLVICVLLLWGAFQALFVPAGEYVSRSTVYLQIAFDLSMTVALAAMLVQNASKPPTALSGWLAWLGPVAMIGGVVQLVARVSSDHGWWTGHFRAPDF